MFPLGNLNWRLFGNMADQKIDQYVLAVIRLLHSFQHQRAQPLRI